MHPWRFTALIALISGIFFGTEYGFPLKLEARTRPKSVQEAEEETRHAESPRAIQAATSDLQKAVNGKASVRNECQSQGKGIEIEENAEIVETDHCKIVVKTRKTTHSENSPGSSEPTSKTIEFMLYADLANLTTPVLTETQKFAQCQASGQGVLKVSSRSDPKEPIRVVRRSSTTASEGSNQTRKDLSLFFADPMAAKRAAKALDRAVKACGGKEWPDEDDLP